MPEHERIELRPVHKTLMWATSEDGKRLYKIEHAGAWDAPDEYNDDSDDRRSGCYYEDDDIPVGAISLYRVTEVIGMKPTLRSRIARALTSGGYSLLGSATSPSAEQPQTTPLQDDNLGPESL